MKCAFLSNVNIESLARRIAGHEVTIAEGYGVWAQELANPSSALWASSPAAIFLLLDGAELARKAASPAYEAPTFDAMVAELEESLTWITRTAEAHPGVKLFVSTLDIPPQWLKSLKPSSTERRLEHHWYGRIVAVTEAHPNVYIFDPKAIAEAMGRDQYYSSKRWYLGGMRYSVNGEKAIAKEITRILDAQSKSRKKVLLLDLDNTLWGGVIGEDGLKGIALSETGEGARFKDFQRKILQLKGLGVVLGIVSKNNEGDVAEVFDSHPDMLLKRDDFAIRKVNWTPKPQNIAEIATDLDLGSDSFVFIDDNPVERDAVRTSMPEVVVPEFPADTCLLPAFLEEIHQTYFFALESTEEDRARTESYLQNAKRSADRSAAASIDDFLIALQTKITFGPIGDDDVARTAQLTQKTNQFNLSTRRYTEQEIQGFRASPDYGVYIASVADKYGDNGKVVMAIVHKTSKKEAELDTYLMSCRVMGRFIEDQIFDHLMTELRKEGITTLRVPFVPTKKNAPAKAFCDRLQGGVVTEEANGGKTWVFDLGEASPVTKPAYGELIAK